MERNQGHQVGPRSDQGRAKNRQNRPGHTCQSSGCCLQDEAFGLWTEEWGSLYEEGSASRQLLQRIRDTWLLVSLVENDYINSDLFAVFGLPRANGSAANGVSA